MSTKDADWKNIPVKWRDRSVLVYGNWSAESGDAIRGIEGAKVKYKLAEKDKAIKKHN